MSSRDVALEDMTKLKELIDANTFAPVLQQMQQRAWLMHWGLYIFFNHENGRNLIVDTLFQDRHVANAAPCAGASARQYCASHTCFGCSLSLPPCKPGMWSSVSGRDSGRIPMMSTWLCRYLNAVQTTAQHLLRYLAAAVVVNKRRRSLLKDMVKVRIRPE